MLTSTSPTDRPHDRSSASAHATQPLKLNAGAEPAKGMKSSTPRNHLAMMHSRIRRLRHKFADFEGYSLEGVFT